jgi:hypothetical protein
MKVGANIESAVSERGYYTQVSHHLFSLYAKYITKFLNLFSLNPSP